MKEIINFGVIGADFTLRANMVLENYPKDRSKLVALCDTNPEILKRFQDENPGTDVKCFTSLDEFLALPEMDAVFIMTRDTFHEELAVASLEAGKAVYLEKPMAITIEGCDRILETAKTHFETNNSLTLAQLRDMLNTSRKYAQALVEYFDKIHITKKDGDIHYLDQGF